MAAALGADRVIVSQGTILAGKAGAAPTLPEIQSLNTIRNLASDAVGFFGAGNAQYPGYRYQSTDQNGKVHYQYGAAIAELRTRLSAIETVARQDNGFRSKTVATLARNALQQNTWDHLLDQGSAQSRYSALFATINNIAEMSTAPAQPTQTEETLYGSVKQAQQSIQGLKTSLKGVTVADTEAKVQQKIKDLQADIAAIPGWQKVLVVGLARKASLNNQIKDLQNKLATLKAAKPDTQITQLSSTARQAYEVGQNGWKVRNVEEADAYATEASPVINEARGIGRKAVQDANHIQALRKKLNQ